MVVVSEEILATGFLSTSGALAFGGEGSHSRLGPSTDNFALPPLVSFS